MRSIASTGERVDGYGGDRLSRSDTPELDCAPSRYLWFESEDRDLKFRAELPLEGEYVLPPVAADEYEAGTARFPWPDGVVAKPGAGRMEAERVGDELVLRVDFSVRCVEVEGSPIYRFTCEPVPLVEEYRIRVAPDPCEWAAGSADPAFGFCHPTGDGRCVGDPPAAPQD